MMMSEKDRVQDRARRWVVQYAHLIAEVCNRDAYPGMAVPPVDAKELMGVAATLVAGAEVAEAVRDRGLASD